MVNPQFDADRVPRPTGELAEAFRLESPLLSHLPPLPAQVPKYERLPASLCRVMVRAYWSTAPEDRPGFVLHLRLRSRPKLDLSPLEEFLLGLSPAERRVLRMFVSDLNRVEIAARLQLRPKTIETHCGRIHRKLGVRSIRGAVVRYLQAALAEGGGR